MSKVINSLNRWKTSLLDTTKRNRAINFKKLKKSTIDIVYPSFVEFLSDIEKKSLPFFDLFNGPDKKRSKEEDKDYVLSYGLSILKKDEYNKQEINDLVSNFILKTKTKNAVFSSSYSDIQTTKLRSISNQARLFEEENALNVLYIAVGMLEWSENEKGSIIYRSPLMFLPASLSQDSIKDPFKLKLREYDIIPNDSLIRYMSDNFKYDLTFDFNLEKSLLENYIDYKTLILQKLATSSEWTIEDEINISTFKFNNINMVKDLEDNEAEILNHNLIRSLAGELTDLNVNDGPFLNEKEVDKLQDPNNFYQALDSDSSQSVAINAAISGKSFVLEGPPGTGKSQTITNIITELIARNKKVLFVAEKKAALDVVYNNLKNIKLNDYALTLHNTNLDKKETISDLADSLFERQGNYERLNNQIKQDINYNYINSKNILNKYGKSLINERKPLNMSVYDLYGKFFSLYEYSEIRFNIENVENINSHKLQEIRFLIIELEKSMQTFNGDIKSNPWYGLKLTNVSYKDNENIDELLSNLKTNINKCKIIRDSIGIRLNIILNNFSIKGLNKLIGLINNTSEILTKDSHIENYYFDNENRLEFDYDLYQKILGEKINIDTLIEKTNNYDLEVLSLDIYRYNRIVSIKRSLISRLFSKEYRSMKKELLLYQKRKNIRYKEIIKDLANLKDYKDSLRNINETQKMIENNIYITFEAEELSRKLDLMKKYIEYIKLYNNIFDSKDYKLLLESLRSDIKIYREVEQLDSIIKKINDDSINFSAIYNSFDDFLIENVEKLERKTIELLENKMYATEMAKINELKLKLINLGLEDFFEIIISNKITNNLENIYLRRHYYILINYYIEKDEVLADFNSNKYLTIKEEFRNNDNKLIETSTLKIREILNRNVPNINGVEGNNTEVKTLMRENNKSRKIMPIRKLFDNIPNLILKLKPVLMMSPLSVSTFLRTSEYKFDVVIFDEASQVYPENAIGALYRSKQFIIVGDTKQLPPTNFFRTIDSDDDDDDTDISDFESILDIASSALSPISLKWHYRSKFEELISPSNREMYGNLLITFPQSKTSNTREGLEFEKVNGVYKNSTNQIEAERVVDLIFQHFDEFGLDRSLGVVTFNKKQTSLIEDILLKKRRENQDYEEFFSYDDKKEPFFIKNLENVQGDERDTMIMSVTYGPDIHGRVLMNFGPINNIGGNRRLNVAITRAKYNLIIVSSMTHEDIDLDRAKGNGPAFLKQILKYAELGFDDKVDAIDVYAGFDSPFEEEVYREIINLGYKANAQVGSSGYKIDLGVLDPKNENKYILGIECDGASYHSSTSARERDRLRQQVLESRGWKIYRIWSTDWFKNRAIEIKKIKEAIESAKNNSRLKEKSDKDLLDIKVETVFIKEEKLFDYYPNYNFIIETSRYYDNIDFIDFLLDLTAPIHIDEIKKIIPFRYRREKFTSYVEDRFKKDLMNFKLSRKYQINGKFIEKYNQKYTFRKVEDFKKSRDFINIHPIELKNGITTIINQAESISKNDLQNILRDYSGYQSSSINMKKLINKAIEDLLEMNVVKIDDEEILKIN